MTPTFCLSKRRATSAKCIPPTCTLCPLSLLLGDRPGGSKAASFPISGNQSCPEKRNFSERTALFALVLVCFDGCPKFSDGDKFHVRMSCTMYNTHRQFLEQTKEFLSTFYGTKIGDNLLCTLFYTKIFESLHVFLSK